MLVHALIVTGLSHDNGVIQLSLLWAQWHNASLVISHGLNIPLLSIYTHCVHLSCFMFITGFLCLITLSNEIINVVWRYSNTVHWKTAACVSCRQYYEQFCWYMNLPKLISLSSFHEKLSFRTASWNPHFVFFSTECYGCIVNVLRSYYLHTVHACFWFSSVYSQSAVKVDAERTRFYSWNPLAWTGLNINQMLVLREEWYHSGINRWQ